MTVEYQNIICKTRRSYENGKQVCWPGFRMQIQMGAISGHLSCDGSNSDNRDQAWVLLVGLSNSDTAVWISIEFDPCWNICPKSLSPMWKLGPLSCRKIAINAILHWICIVHRYLYYQRSLIKELASFFEVGQQTIATQNEKWLK